MGNKNKTVSFRVNEDTFEELRAVAEERDLSLSAVFREYVDTFVANDGRVRVVAEDSTADPEGGFPPTVEVPMSFVREHERLELEAEHLREALEEHKRYIRTLQERLEDAEPEDVVYLEDLDEEIAEGTSGEDRQAADEPDDWDGEFDIGRFRRREGLFPERDDPYRLG